MPWSPDFASAPGYRAEPTSGRVFAARRIVRSTDVTPSGRLRLDALARYLQTAAEDDVADAALAEPVVWLVRRCQLAVRSLPAMGERLQIRTFCSGTGARWAERTTTLYGSGGPLVQAIAVWAAVSRHSGRPVPLSDAFLRSYGGAAAAAPCRHACPMIAAVTARQSQPGLAAASRGLRYRRARQQRGALGRGRGCAGRSRLAADRWPRWSTTARSCPAAHRACLSGKASATRRSGC